jgi:hypothetical protein
MREGLPGRREIINYLGKYPTRLAAREDVERLNKHLHNPVDGPLQKNEKVVQPRWPVFP